MLPRKNSQEDSPLLQHDALRQPMQPDCVQLLPMDVLALVIKYLPFEDAISFMLSHRRAFSLFDNNRLNNYMNIVPCRGKEGFKVVSYLNVNYLMLTAHFHKKQLKVMVSGQPAQLQAEAQRNMKKALGIGTAVGCVITSLISLPAPIIACVSGSAACGGTKVLVGTSILGPLLGSALAARTVVEHRDRGLQQIHDDQREKARRLSASLGMLSIEGKSPLILKSLFRANAIQREKQQQMIKDIAEEKPRRITME